MCLRNRFLRNREPGDNYTAQDAVSDAVDGVFPNMSWVAALSPIWVPCIGVPVLVAYIYITTK